LCRHLLCAKWRHDPSE